MQHRALNIQITLPLRIGGGEPVAVKEGSRPNLPPMILEPCSVIACCQISSPIGCHERLGRPLYRREVLHAIRLTRSDQCSDSCDALRQVFFVSWFETAPEQDPNIAEHAGQGT